MTRAQPLSRATMLALLLAIWAAASAVMLVLDWGTLMQLDFSDPDDALRLVQVRDLLAGQSWFDLTQHRINPPEGVPMHWSRLVDLPIAIIIAGLTPLFGAGFAERAALAIVPLAQLLALMLITCRIARRLGLGQGTSLLAVALLCTSLSILIQFHPLRIDHHGVQIVLGALAVLALVSTQRRDGRMGTLAGLAMACWLQISLEGLPCAVAIGVILGVRHMLRVDCWTDMRNYLLSLTAGSALLLFTTRGPADALTAWCDSFSPAYLLPLATACLALLAGGARMQRNAMIGRIMPLAMGSAAGGVAFLFMSGRCLAGPFETLDPIVYKYWYLSVQEGMPVWSQPLDIQLMVVMPALLGLVGSIVAWRRALGPEQRTAWASLFAMQLLTFAVSTDVLRAMCFAHLLALPGNAVLLARLLGAVQRLNVMPMRVLLSTGTIVLTPFGATAAVAAALDTVNAAETSAEDPGAKRLACANGSELRGLDTLPVATLFTPLDIGAHMLVYTHHKVVGTGHHRNIEGMRTVISAFLASPQEARDIVTTSGADYLALCTGKNEVRQYRQNAPRSLTALLLSGRHPDWLEPVPMRPGETIRVYRILRAKQAA